MIFLVPDSNGALPQASPDVQSLQMVQGKHLTLLTSTGRLLLHQRAYSYRFTALKGGELGGGVQHFVLQRALQVLAVRWVQLQLTPTQPP